MIQRRSCVAACATGAVAVVVVLFMQWALGVWRLGWGGLSDPPAHLVSSVVIRQYALDGLLAGKPPMEFAQAFYHRFPKVAIGHWPPVFHGTMAAWLLVGSLDPEWIFCLQAVLAGLLSALTTLLGSMVLDVKRAMLAGIAVVFTSPILSAQRLVMPDILVAVWVACGLIAFLHFWREPSMHASLIYGFSLAAALLTKPSGAVLALVPPLYILLTRRWTILKEWSFWLMFLPAALLYVPWHFVFAEAMRDGWRAPRGFSLNRFTELPRQNLVLLARSIGWVGLPLGLWCVWQTRSQKVWGVLGATVAGAFLLFAFLVPVRAPRHYAPVTPALAVLAIGGIKEAARRWGRRLEPAGWLILAGGLLAANPHLNQDLGSRAMVAELLSQPSPQIWLVSGGPVLEGEVIAEGATKRPSRGLTVYRASKLFVKGDWSGRHDRLIVHSVEESRLLLERCGIEIAVLGKQTPAVIADAIVANPSRWRLRQTGLNPDTGVVYERIGPARQGLGEPIIQKP